MTANSKKHTGNLQAEKDFILSEAGRCVACGLCLPHCPTYQLKQLETESPRGRVSLISALASDELIASDTLEKLLHNCLLCQACENMCPSSVSFSLLMDKGRHLHRLLQKNTSIRELAANKVVDYLLHNPEWLRLTSYITSPLGSLGRNQKEESDGTLQTKRTFSDYLPSVNPHKRWKNKYPVKKSNKQLSLFLGCVSRSFDGETLDDAIFVLNQIGYSVVIPDAQVCCGALSLHAGREEESLTMMKENILAFEAVQTLPIVYTASGCGQALKKYHDYLTDQGFSSRINEVCQFIDAHWPENMDFSSPAQKVLLHTPCSLDNSENSSAPHRLLSRFKNVNLQSSSSDYHCCGASGTKMLVDFNTSTALRDPVLNQIKQEKPDVVVSSNIGCALHLAEGLRQARLNIPVKHPVSLIAEFFRDTLHLPSKD